MRVPMEISAVESRLTVVIASVSLEISGWKRKHWSGYQVTSYLAKSFASTFAEDSAGNQVYTCVGGNQIFGFAHKGRVAQKVTGLHKK